MKDKEKLKSSFQYNKIIEMGIMMTKYLKDGEVEKFGNILNEYWQMKRNRQAIYTDNKVDEIYNLAMQNGAIGGKLVGAGGSGFLLFVTNKPKKLRHAMNNAGIKELVFNIAKKGVEVVQH